MFTTYNIITQNLDANKINKKLYAAVVFKHPKKHRKIK
jgi:hypothetical protein